MSSNKGITESEMIGSDDVNSVLELLEVEDQLRVDDDVLTARLPGRRSHRNRVIYNRGRSKASSSKKAVEQKSHAQFKGRQLAIPASVN